jgi:hypothetical protein
MTRGLANDNAALHRVADDYPELAEYYYLNRKGIRVTMQQFNELRKKLGELIASIEETEDEGERLNFFVVVAPTMATCKSWAKRNKPK